MTACPHSIYFFRGSVEDFGLIDEYKGDKTSYELTRSPNPLLTLRDEGDYYRSTEKFVTNSNFITPGVEIKKGEYVRITSISSGSSRVAKFDIMGDSFVNTFRDWNIVPLERPVVAPPEQKTHIIEIPGASGVLDISNSLTKYPVFNNRTGSWTFAIRKEETDTPTSYGKMLNFLQGSDVKFILEDDQLYYYQGRVYVDSISPKADGTWSEVTIGYDLDPYKRSVLTSVSTWNWDKFKFNTDEINPTIFKNIKIPPSRANCKPEERVWYTRDFSDYVGIMPVIPTFSYDLPYGGTLYMKLYNHDLGINWKEYSFSEGSTSKTFSDLILCEFTKESKIQMMFSYVPRSTSSNDARISVIFRSGRL